MICTKCGKDKSVDDFYDRHKTSSSAGRKKSICKLCQHERNRESNVVRRREHRDRLTEIKLKNGCVDCGFNSYAPSLHFDHRNPEEKRFVIAHCLLYSWETILKEVAKCDVRCSICHTKRHQATAVVSGSILPS